MFGSKIKRENKGVIKGIRDGQRREPRHNPAASVEANGTTMMQPEHRIVFDDFRRFGEIINTMMHHGPFSFEETPKVEFGFDGPDYGHIYQVYYNAVPCGRLTIGVAHLLHASEGHGAMGELDLDYAQLMPEGEIRDMLRTMWFMFAKTEDGAVMRAKADLEVVKIITRHLWEVMREPEFVHQLHWRFEGPYEHYSEYLQPRHVLPSFDFKFGPGQA